LKNYKKGNHTYEWNGKGMDKVRSPSGLYSAKVFAWDSNSGTIPTEVRSKGIVNGVTFENDETVLWLKSGKKIFLRDVKSFNLPDQLNKKDWSSGRMKGPPKAIHRDLVSKYKKEMN
jgi:hypothetical protein